MIYTAHHLIELSRCGMLVKAASFTWKHCKPCYDIAGDFYVLALLYLRMITSELLYIILFYN